MWQEGGLSQQVNPGLPGGQKKARVYKQNFSVRVTLPSGQLNARLLSKGLEKIRKLIRLDGLTLPARVLWLSCKHDKRKEEEMCKW